MPIWEAGDAPRPVPPPRILARAHISESQASIRPPTTLRPYLLRRILGRCRSTTSIAMTVVGRQMAVRHGIQRCGWEVLEATGLAATPILPAPLGFNRNKVLLFVRQDA